jgi:HlyD family secretion protein
MAVIADMSELSFTINVDELDIAKVKAGQNAIVTVDALAGRVFSGVVDNVGILGTSSNGVTTYPVKVRLEQTEGLWPGMNATATIVVDSVSDVLMIPITAVSRGSLALVKGAASAEDVPQDEAPEGAAYTRIETGLNNESFIEVKNGLSEGDIVLVTATPAGELQQSQNMMMGPGFGTTTVRVGAPGAGPGGGTGRPPGSGGQGGSGGGAAPAGGGAGPGSGDGGGG